MHFLQASALLKFCYFLWYNKSAISREVQKQHSTKTNHTVTISISVKMSSRQATTSENLSSQWTLSDLDPAPNELDLSFPAPNRRAKFHQFHSKMRPQERWQTDTQTDMHSCRR